MFIHGSDNNIISTLGQPYGEPRGCHGSCWLSRSPRSLSRFSFSDARAICGSGGSGDLLLHRCSYV